MLRLRVCPSKQRRFSWLTFQIAALPLGSLSRPGTCEKETRLSIALSIAAAMVFDLRAGFAGVIRLQVG